MTIELKFHFAYSYWTIKYSLLRSFTIIVSLIGLDWQITLFGYFILIDIFFLTAKFVQTFLNPVN